MEEIITKFKSLSKKEQLILLEILSLFKQENSIDDENNLLKIKEIQLNNKQGTCPHCNHEKYTKHGKDKGIQRYICKKCKKTFTSFTGTWLAHIHKKDKLSQYIMLMQEHLSLQKIADKLYISKKTSLDWRHKILSSMEDIETDEFIGITELDETYFLFSEKGKRDLDRSGRKRGGKSKKTGTNKEQISVCTTFDRQSTKDLKVVGNKNSHKAMIKNIIGDKISTKTVLCTDGHLTYKSLAKELGVEHHVLVASKKERVKGIYHIQTVNSAHSRLKGWINGLFKGVSTKYLQKYLNWFRFKEKFKNESFFENILKKTMVDIQSWARFKRINEEYLELIEIPTLN